VDVRAEPDSGADVNLMDEHQFKAFAKRSKTKPTLKPSSVKLATLQHKLEVKGEFETIIRNQTCGKAAKFIVVYGHINSPPLISKETLIQLGMMKIQSDGGLTQPNEMKIKHTETSRGEEVMKEIISKYEHVFHGIGKIHDYVNNKELYGKFHMKPEAVPVAQKPRPIPYYLKEPLQKWIDQGVKEDIFEKVPENEPITWCSPIVVQPKPSFNTTPKEDLEPHMIRASVDLRVPNQYMERSRITQPPLVEDFTHNFHDCKV